MSKLILMSFMIAMIVVPTRAARIPDPKLGLKKVYVQILAYEVFYAFALMYLWGRF